jgi:hypothetical protein
MLFDRWMRNSLFEIANPLHATTERMGLLTLAAPSAAAVARAAWYDQRRVYRRLRHLKATEFWRARVASAQSDPRRLWRSVDTLLGRGRLSVGASLTADSFGRFFFDKVDAVRRATCGSPQPSFSLNPSTSSLRQFQGASPDEVATIIRQLPDKSSAADPLPTSVLKDIADLVSPYVAHLFNRSVSSSQFPTKFKRTFITPIVKKPGLDAEDVKSYRPISNLSVLSKPFAVDGATCPFCDLHSTRGASTG